MKTHAALKAPPVQTAFSAVELAKHQLFISLVVATGIAYLIASLVNENGPHLTSFWWRLTLILAALTSVNAFTSYARDSERLMLGVPLLGANMWLCQRFHHSGASYGSLIYLYSPYLILYPWSVWNDLYYRWYQSKLPASVRASKMAEAMAIEQSRTDFLNGDPVRPSASTAASAMSNLQAMRTDETSTQYVAKRVETKFADIFGMQEVKETIRGIVRSIIEAKGKGTKSKNGILLHGAPGNAKTMLAEAIAGEMSLPLLSVNFGDFASRYVGQVPEQVKKCFDDARAQAPCVLFLDEVDSLMVDRQTIQRGESEESKVTNILLAETVALRGSGIVLVAATNYLDRLDPAAIRPGRFDFKVEVTNPDYEARSGIFFHALKKALRESGKSCSYTIDPAGLDLALRRWDGFSGAMMASIGTEAAEWLMMQVQKATITFDALYAITRRVQGNTGKIRETVPSLEELSQTEAVRVALKRIATRMNRMYELDQMGGNLPGGLLFGGPGRSGKTTAAMALAKSTDWRFVELAGHEVLAEPALLEKKFKEAANLRPAILFIDEAEVILRDRRASNAGHITNEFLTLMSGVNSKPKDVLVIAATNFPEELDPAVVGGGRLTEKVMFGQADASQLSQVIRQWLDGLKLPIARDISVDWLQSRLQGLTVGNISALLQNVVDNVAARKLDGGSGLIEREDVEVAFTTLFPKA